MKKRKMMIGNKPFNIVVFGCDNTGKTTLCSGLEEYYRSKHNLKVNMVHSLGPNKTVDEQIEFMKLSFNNNVSDMNIFDRFPIIEETVCGTVLRNHNNFTENSFKGLFGYSYLRYVDIFVFCNPGLQKIINWGTREQMEGVKENVVDLMNGYNKFAYELMQNGFEVFEYNYCINSSYDTLVAKTENMIKEKGE